MMSRRRVNSVRLRPLRAMAFVVSVSLTLTAAVATVGLLPEQSVAAAGNGHSQSPDDALVWPGLDPLVMTGSRLAEGPVLTPSDRPAKSRSGRVRIDPAPPVRSGEGRRIVFDLSGQQVWLVGRAGSVQSTYLVSGSVYDNLDPGRYEVYSRSANATSFDYSSTMRWMVRFTEGDVAAIGFHDIPRTFGGEPLQTRSELGTPQSHGCIRQRPRDAKALWDFAPLGTSVVVVA